MVFSPLWSSLGMLCVFYYTLFILCPPAHTAPLQKIAFWQANLHLAADALARKAGFNLLLTNPAEAKNIPVSATFTHIEPLDALTALLNANGYSYEVQHKLLIAFPTTTTPSPGYARTTTHVPLTSLSPTEAKTLLKEIFPHLVATPLPHGEALLLTGRRSHIEQAKRQLQQADQATPQVRIACQIIELSESASQQLGFTWGAGQGTFQFGLDPTTGQVLPTGDLMATLSLFAGNGEAKLLAHPTITVLNQEEATIQIGDRVPFAKPAVGSGGTIFWSIEYLETGLALKVTPTVTGGEEILVTVRPEMSAIKEWRPTEAGAFPVIATRNARTQVRLKNGETFALGGLLSEEARTARSAIPFLGALPLVGHLFQKDISETTQTDIVFLLTPHLLDTAGQK